MRKSTSYSFKLRPTLMLLGSALVLTACNGSTKVVRANLDPPGLAALRGQVVARCSPIPRAWPAEAAASQALTERYLKRDQADTEACASTSIRFANRVAARDRELTKSIK